ncbi:glycosyltransferase [Geobacter argillaceus]|uniref:O-antigen/teichoic acid export membrane protein n=1 Tax=Geobacter argillaceus TaxID=345631 RepID=A0A562VFX7_9BACT|nr:glycosyltransferase [Geobacter argillaceus]TWJ16711.1 O-antigen/teichoic acid export membrane protein [Geobacter argillaceus]
MKISIALCSYNGEEFLGEQLASIARQSRLPDELIVVDDGSTDSTVTIIREFAQTAGFPVKIFTNEVTLGVTKNFEKAVLQCSSDIIVFADQDDVWLPQKLMCMELEFARDTRVGMVFSDAVVVDERKRPLGYRLWEQVRFTGGLQRRVRRGDGFRVLIKYNVVTGATMAFRSKHLDMVLPFPENWLHDGWVALIVAAVARVNLIGEPLILYRQHSRNQVGAARKTLARVARSAKLHGFQGFYTLAEEYSVVYRHLLTRAGTAAEQLQLIRGKVRHLTFRANLPRKRVNRVLPVFAELLTLRYSRFATGYKSALRDLWTQPTKVSCCPEPTWPSIEGNYSLVRRISATRLRPLLERIKASPTGSRLARGMLWSLAGTVVSRALSVLSSIIAARLLGTEGFGEFGMLQSTVGMLGMFAGFGLATTATKHVAEFRNTDPDRAGRILALSGATAVISGGGMALALYLFSPWLAGHLLAAPNLAGLLRLCSVYLFLSAVTGAQYGALAGFEAFREIAGNNFVTGLVSFAFVFAGIVIDGIRGGVWGMVASAGFSWVAAGLTLWAVAGRARIHFIWTGIWQERRVLGTYSLPSVLAGSLSGAPIGWLCCAMLVNQPGGYAQMGVYNSTNQWFNLVLFLPGLLSQVVLPVLAESIGDDGVKSGKVIKAAFMANAATTVPLVVLASLASPWIMAAYGAGFQSAWLTLVLVLVTAGVMAVQTPAVDLLATNDRVWRILLFNCVWAVMFIVLSALLVRWGALGLATARLVACLVQTCWTVGYVYCVFWRPRMRFADGRRPLPCHCEKRSGEESG